MVTPFMERYGYNDYGLIENPYGFVLDLRRLSNRAAEVASSKSGHSMETPGI